MRSRILVAALAICPTSFAVVPAGNPIEVVLKIHSDINPWTLSSGTMPVPSWEKDGTLSILYLAYGDGSAHIVETGARANLSKNELSLCYSRAPQHYEPNQPIPAIAYPVPIEFRIKGLEHRDYKVKQVTICK